MTEAPRALFDDVMFGWHKDAAGYKIRHVPATLPDMLKTAAVVKWEYRDAFGHSAKQALTAFEAQMEWMRGARSDYEIAIPLHGLADFAAGTGYWAGLPVAARLDQLDHLTRLSEQLYPSLRLYLFDAHRVFSSPVTVFGPHLAAIYLGRHYIAFRDPSRVASISQHFDWLLREAVCSAAVRAALAVGYVGAGTVEFIADGSEGLRPDRIWFMEMNTRLQVEHPVTEMITGLDLVEWQLRVASGEPLPQSQDQIQIQGHAIEARLYAENPATGFLPSTGPLTHFRLPQEGLRIDSAVEEGGEVTPFYDPMIAKLIVHRPSRQAAAAALAKACRAVEVWPVKTNAAFLARCLDHADFVQGDIDTGFIEARQPALVDLGEPSNAVLTAAVSALARAAQPAGPSPWANLEGFRINSRPRIEGSVDGGGKRYDLSLQGLAPSTLSTRLIDDQVLVFEDGAVHAFTSWRSHRGDSAQASDGAMLSPMPGRMVAVMVEVGQAVTRGQALVTLEAMKMEHVLTAPFDGTVEQLSVALGDQVSEGVVLVQLAASQDS